MTLIKRIVRTYKDAYTGLPKAAWMLSFIELVNRCGTMVFFFMTLYLTQTFGFSTSQAGQIISGYGLGALFGSYLGGKLCDVMGAYKIQKLSLFFSGICYLWLGHLSSYWWILVMMFILGVVSEALHPANSTAISQVCTAELRTKGFALNRLATNLGVTIGPALGGYLALINYKLLFWIDGFTCLAALIPFLLFFKMDRPPDVSGSKTPGTKSANQSPWKDFHFLSILVLVFVGALVFVQLFSTYPIYFRTIYRFKENSIGTLIAINTIIIVLFEMVLINALKNKNQLKIIAIGQLLLGLGFAIMPLGRGYLYAAFTVAVWTMGEMLSFPALTAHIANISDAAVRGRYMGLFSLSFSLSLLVGPALGSMVYDNLGPDVLWFCSGIVGIIIFVGFFKLKPKVKP